MVVDVIITIGAGVGAGGSSKANGRGTGTGIMGYDAALRHAGDGGPAAAVNRDALERTRSGLAVEHERAGASSVAGRARRQRGRAPRRGNSRAQLQLSMFSNL